MKPQHALCLLLALTACSPREEAPPAPVVDVAVAKAELAQVKSTVQAPAFIFPRTQANISSRVTAPIRKLFVRKGDTVTSGQILAELDNRDLLAQRDEAAAAVTDAEANLERVRSGTLPTDIERARGQVALTEAALHQAQKFYDRRRQLFEQGAIPQRDLLVSETELAQAKANYEVARRSLDLLLNQSREKDILMAKSKVEQARAHLAAIQAQLDFTAIRSSSAGTVTEQFMFPGDMAKPDAPIFTVMDLSVAVARVQIPDSEAAAVHTGQPCAFAPADSPGASFSGRVTVVNQSIDPARRTVESWCEIPNPDHQLLAGAFGQVSIVTSVTPNAVVVPLPAVQFFEGSHKGIVMLAGDQGVAVKREVVTGAVFEGKVHIKSGLNPGQTVIVQGGYALEEGTRIRIREAVKP
jgi:multidrug efflux pump subunit AcrA (membrane-fusion protein)